MPSLGQTFDAVSAVAMKAKDAVTTTTPKPERFTPLDSPVIVEPRALSADSVPENRTRNYSYQELLGYANRAKQEGYNEARIDNNLKLSEMKLEQSENSGNKNFWMGCLITAVVLFGGFTAITVWRKQ